MDEQQRWYAANIHLQDQVIADVGANVGKLSQFFWEASNGTSRVVSIEPLPDNVAEIRERIRAAGTEQWTVEPCAVSGRAGTLGLALSRTPEGHLNSMVVQNKPKLKVPCRPLSKLVPDATVVKIDIEGHEYVVLDEALSRLTAAHTWAVELHMVPTRPLQKVLGAFMAAGLAVYAAVGPVDAADGAWASHELMPTLDWSAVPVTRVRGDGSVFKMLHIIATRNRIPL
ncbi:MAG: FkbM family methyltransferase [Burkholderiales bacterium]|nr:FkbM family methyltransferase [Burkholderiales bacterium]